MRVLSFGHAFQATPEADLVLDCREMKSANPELPAAKRLLAIARRHAREHPDAVIAFGCEFGQLRSCVLADVLADEFDVMAEHLAPPETDMPWDEDFPVVAQEFFVADPGDVARSVEQGDARSLARSGRYTVWPTRNHRRIFLVGTSDGL